MGERVGTWYLIKYVRDLARQEPVNVGVAFKERHGWRTMFLGQNSDGAIANNLTAGLIRESYVNWVDYFRRQAANDDWPAVIAHQERRAVNFYVERGGVLLDEIDTHTLDGLFASLVGHRSSGPTETNRIRDAVDVVFERAKISPVREQVVEGVYAPGAPRHPIKFDYGYQNGQLHLISALTARRDMITHAEVLNARISAAMRAAVSKSFWVFYSSAAVGVEEDAVLAPLDKLALSINVDETEQAVQQVTELVKH